MTLDYYLARGYSQDEASQALKERQGTFSLEKCISKYGEIDGLIRFNERQAQWQATLNSKSDDEIADINRRKSKPVTGRRISTLNKNFESVLIDLGLSYESEFSVKSILAEDVWQHDKLKCDTAINAGFEYIVIWEYDFINNKDKIIEKVLKYVQSR